MIDVLNTQHDTPTFAEQAAQYPFLNKLYNLSQLSLQKGKVLPNGADKPNGFVSTISSSTKRSEGFSVDSRCGQTYSCAIVTEPGEHVSNEELFRRLDLTPKKIETPTITLRKHGPPDPEKKYAVCSHSMTLRVDSDGQINALSVREPYWYEIMGENVHFPFDAVGQGNHSDYTLVNKITDISDIDPKIVEFISKSIDQAYQAFGVAVSPQLPTK